MHRSQYPPRGPQASSPEILGRVERPYARPDPRWAQQTAGPDFRTPETRFLSTRTLQGDLDPRLVLLTEPDSARAASYRMLRDNLLGKGLPRVLAVSSAGTKDGKTTCALNLALSLSERSRVLLIDGNLSEPVLAKVFTIDESTPALPVDAPWLAPYEIFEFSRGLSIATLRVRQGDSPPRFEKHWFDTLIGSLRRVHYEFILIDAPALSASPSVSQLLAAADATLLAVRAGGTTARALRRATAEIPRGRAIGLALIDAPQKS